MTSSTTFLVTLEIQGLFLFYNERLLFSFFFSFESFNVFLSISSSFLYWFLYNLIKLNLIQSIRKSTRLEQHLLSAGQSNIFLYVKFKKINIA